MSVFRREKKVFFLFQIPSTDFEVTRYKNTTGTLEICKKKNLPVARAVKNNLKEKTILKIILQTSEKNFFLLNKVKYSRTKKYRIFCLKKKTKGFVIFFANKKVVFCTERENMFSFLCCFYFSTFSQQLFI